MSTLIAALAVYLPVSWAISIALFGHHLPPQSTDARPRRRQRRLHCALCGLGITAGPPTVWSGPPTVAPYCSPGCLTTAQAAAASEPTARHRPRSAGSAR